MIPVFWLLISLVLANITLAFSLNNTVFLTGFLSIILILSFLLLLFNYLFVTLFLLIAYTSIILVLFLVNGLLTMHSLSFRTISFSTKFKLLINYSLPLCSYNRNYLSYVSYFFSYFSYAPLLGHVFSVECRNKRVALYLKFQELQYSYSSLFLFLYSLLLLSYFDFLMIYVSNLNLFTTKMNALGTKIFASSLFPILFSMFLIILTSINMMFLIMRSI